MHEMPSRDLGTRDAFKISPDEGFFCSLHLFGTLWGERGDESKETNVSVTTEAELRHDSVTIAQDRLQYLLVCAIQMPKCPTEDRKVSMDLCFVLLQRDNVDFCMTRVAVLHTQLIA